MYSIYMSPQQYVQEKDVLDQAGELIAPLSKKPLVLSDELVGGLINDRLKKSFRKCGIQPCFVLFGGESTDTEVARLQSIMDQEGLDSIIGTGGGKAIDTSRFVAERNVVPLITIPTSAATCSGASAAAVLYDDNGKRLATVDGKGPSLTIVDSRIIAEAPVRYLSSGIADALSKWYEGRITAAKIKMNPRVDGSIHLSRHIRDEIFNYGRKACADVEKKQLTPAVEKIIGINILLTAVVGGMGGSLVRIVGAHSFLYAMTIIEGVHELLHGEVVSFGLLVQLVLEQEFAELRNLMAFFKDIGLPLTLEELGMGYISEAQLARGAQLMTMEGNPIHNLPYPVTSKDVLHAIYQVDEMAVALKQKE